MTAENVPDDRLDLLENMPCAFHSLGPDAVIRKVNATWLRWLGYTREEVEGKLPFTAVLTEASRASLAERFPGFQGDGRLDDVELTMRRKDGSTFPALVSAAAVYDAHGRFAWSRSGFIDISGHRLAEERRRRLMDAAPDPMVVVDAEGRIALANLQVERVFGHSPTELVGQPLAVLLPERPDAVDIARHAAAPGTSQGAAMRGGLDLFGRHLDGTEFPVEINLSPFDADDGPHVVAAIRDISERVRVQAAAKLASDRLADAVECIDDAFGIFDADGVLVMHNNAFRTLHDGLFEGALVGRRAEELALALAESTGADPAPRAASGADRPAIFSEPRVIQELERRGRVYRVVTHRTREGGAVVVLSDRSEERLREEALRKASAAKSEFLSSMSHELRTPLNAVLGFSQLLRRDRKTPLTPRQSAMMDHVVSAGEHLLRLIDEVLDLAQIEAGRVSVEVEPIEVAEVVRQAVTTLAPMAARAEIELVVAPSVATGGHVMADRTRLAQVLMNYGSNAIKYGQKGGRATISASHPAAGRVRLSVIDDGIGIPVDKQEHMFRPFHRAGQETGPIEGTGIGLAITRNLVELMGGCVGFHSNPGAGSEFWAELAAAEGGVVQAAPANPGVDSSLAGATPRYTIVYIEDHPANIAFMRHLLSEMPCITLLTAPTAEIGVELVRARRPDAVILDINLPGMSGFEALTLLQAWPETHDIPVLALSAAATERDIRRGQEAGFFRYLTKPVKVDALLSALEQALGPASAVG